jgi:hypothetical protein
MDIQAEKLSLIEWLAGIDDNRIIKQFKILQKASQEQIETQLTADEKKSIDKGLSAISKGNVHLTESVKESTKKKYPQLFK